MEKRFKLKIAGQGEVKAAIVVPDDGDPEASVVLAHGQANDLDHELLTILCDGLEERGYASLRFNFPYKEAGGNTPDSREVLIQAYRAARDELEQRVEDAKIFLAGKSLGARIAASVAEQDGAAGLIFLGYPIHRPGAEPRDYEHIVNIESPMLFFVGTRDPFCKVEKLQKILEQRAGKSLLQVVEDGDHSFVPPEDDERPVELIYETIAMVAADWLDETI